MLMDVDEIAVSKKTQPLPQRHRSWNCREKRKFLIHLYKRIIQPIEFSRDQLGLAISNQLLAPMDSKLQLISMYGDGSDFLFKIKI
jgi:hypothetical protein